MKRYFYLSLVLFAILFSGCISDNSLTIALPEAESVSSFSGTWDLGSGRAIIFDGNKFDYKVNNVTRYSGTFSISGSTITFYESSLGIASGNFELSGGTLVLSNHTWDSSVNGTYTKNNTSSGGGGYSSGSGGGGGYVPPSVIPDAIKDKFEDSSMPIYSGTTPPDISGQYIANAQTLVGSSLSNDNVGSMYTNNGTKWADLYIAFIMGVDGKLSYREKQGSGQSGSDDVKVEIVGNGNDFTAYFVATGTSDGASNTTSTVISGTLTSTGIRNFHYAFVMLEKNDPQNNLVPVNTYRIFKDGDGLAEKHNWYY